jgi:uncharacterized protein YggE
MKKTIPAILLSMLLISLLSACAGLASGASINAARDPNSSANAHTLAVSGMGKVTIIPDIAYVTIGVHTEGSAVSEALQSNTAQAQKVAEALKVLGVDPKDIQTTSFNISPVQQFSPQGEVTSTKYSVDNSVYVIVHDLSKLGAILNSVVSSGANNINGIQYDVLDKDKALAQARSQAVQNALLQATDLAKSAGVTLGAVLSINAINNVPVSMYEAKGGVAMASNGGAAVPVSAGQLIVTVEVNTTYEIK